MSLFLVITDAFLANRFTYLNSVNSIFPISQIIEITRLARIRATFRNIKNSAKKTALLQKQVIDNLLVLTFQNVFILPI